MTTNKKRFQVVADYLQEVTKTPYPKEYPRVMGYYDAVNEQDAFKQFLQEHAPNIRRAQLFYDAVTVIAVPVSGHQFKLSQVYGDLAKFPNPDVLSESDLAGTFERGN